MMKLKLLRQSIDQQILLIGLKETVKVYVILVIQDFIGL